MRKLWLAGLLLIACSAWVAAQTSSSNTSSGSAGTNASSSGTSQSGNSSTGTSSSQSSQPAVSEPGDSSTGVATQQSGQSGAANGTAAPQSSEIRETTIQGCLQGSSGNYTLTDQMGNVHKLQGAEAKLSQHVNQEIEVKGYQTSANNSSANNAPSGSTPSSTSSGGSTSSGASSSSVAKGESPAAFRVHQITQIASTCSTQK